MGSMPLDPPRSAHGTRLRTAHWAAKLAFLLLALASTVFLVRLAVPLSRDLLLSTLPRLCAAARGYLIPPYVFVVVNFMILIILKLPDTKNHNHRKGSPGAAADAAAIPPKPLKNLPRSSPREVPPDEWSDAASPFASATASSPKIGDSSPGGWSNESALTTDFDGDSAVSPSAAAAVIVQNTVESGVRPSVRSSAPVEVGKDYDSIDATWKAITGRRQLKKNETWSTPPRVQLEPGGEPAVLRKLRKSETFRESSSSSSAAATRRVVVERRVNGREVPVPEDHDDINWQSEAFIKKMNDQMRLQRQESAAQRRMEMASPSGY